MNCHAENLDTLRSLLGAPFLGDIPFLSPWEPEQAATHLSLKALGL